VFRCFTLTLLPTLLSPRPSLSRHINTHEQRKSQLQCKLSDFDLSPLTGLRILSLVGTHLNGDLQVSWLKKMKHLHHLDLSNNHLTGHLHHLFPAKTIPTESTSSPSSIVDGKLVNKKNKKEKNKEACEGFCKLTIFDVTGNNIEGE
jgi:hypothetical protein